ncbi:MAG: TetR/AcrR family transcriptional regulator [Solirubrobacteraceae bacterium]|nr:TetR/AcrR family transcriptional regulator [Solirubrobacteraceae bacterium]
MPRRSAAAVADTRAEVLDVAVRRASIDGLEGLTIGQLAGEVSMSKSGLFGLFGSKEELQAATFDAAVTHFTREVWRPVAGREPGLPRLLALVDRWLSYHQRRALPGGCFVTTATIEFDARPGALHDAVARARAQMHAVLEADVRIAVEAGDLPPATNPKDAAFALYALASAASVAIQLEEPGAKARARRCMRSVLGVTG